MAPSRDRRPGFSRRAQYGLFVTYVLGIAGAVVGAVLLALSTFNPAAFAMARAALAEATAPLSSAGGVVVRAVAAVPETIGTWWRVHDENAELRARLARARGALLVGRQARVENARLRTLLQIRDRRQDVVAAARIVSTSASSTRRFGLLNAGSWQGVTDGQPVSGPEGLIGRILYAGPNTARVLLVTDAESVVPVRRSRDGRPALAAGRGDGLIDIRTIDTADGQFRPGDIFVTSGTGGMFIPGVPVAQVLRHGTDSAPARPFARPDVLDFAIVHRAFMPAPPPAPMPTPTPSPAPTPAPPS
ncbi:rod shape-determining protein MreC [Sphingomonas sp. Leaf231]|uniref:rod shape-determining protein MreC n=1 Tax=Sphingomonas sp. Leaf231 TaxID=1736301 RepID=UPI0006F7B8CA|nr:rod shape-determining protein MreC [Sphingomonas sp. Leaf231]KQN93092.1 rod shape-determining protein MreC [Sphingomonas sp. Leaf231]